MGYYMKVTVIAMGTLSEKAFADAFDEYRKRFGAFGTMNVIELKDSKLPKEPSDAQIEASLASEGDEILSKIPSRAFVFVMAIEGKMISSEQFAALFDKKMTEGYGEFVFVIGSSYGLSPAVKKRADLLFSMSPMTFPHQLARVMLGEQIYRAQMILSGGKYHK